MSDYSDIQQELDDFENAVYGEEVRDSMVSAIKKIHDIAESAASASDAVPTEVRQAIFNLLNNNAFANDDTYTVDLAVLDAWASATTAINVTPDTASISGSGTQQLTAVTSPAGASVSWTSSNTAVATVSSSGLVTGVGNGTCTITATSGGVSATCVVTVSGFTMYSVTNNLTNVSNSNTSTSVSSGSGYSANIAVTSAYYDLGTVTVTMGDTDVTSTVYSDGVINIASVTGDIVITATGTAGLYAIDEGTHEFTASGLTGYLTVSDGNLVRFEHTAANTSLNNWFCLNPIENNQSATSNSSNANGATTDTIFSIAANDSVRIVFEDVEGTTSTSNQWCNFYTMLLKHVGSSPSTAITSGQQTTTGDTEVTITASEACDVGAIVGFVSAKVVGYIQYRLRIYVNNVRYI